MQDLFQLSFFKPNGQKATLQIGGYSSNDVLETVKAIMGDQFQELCEFPTRIETEEN